MFEFAFMQRTFIVAACLGVMIPLIGLIMINRKTSMVGDALSHTSLAGVGLGLILGFDPGLGATLICIVSAFAIEALRKHFPQYGDMATAVIMSLGLGIASILSDFAPGGNSLESYLFGSISSATETDVIAVSIVCLLIILLFTFNYSGMLYISVNTNLARLAGVNITLANGLFTLLTAITVALSCKTVGALLVASLLVLPVATVLFLARSYKQLVLGSVFLGLLYMLCGITLSWHFNLKPGGAIVLLAIIGIVSVAAISGFRKPEDLKLNTEKIH